MSSFYIFITAGLLIGICIPWGVYFLQNSLKLQELGAKLDSSKHRKEKRLRNLKRKETDYQKRSLRRLKESDQEHSEESIDSAKSKEEDLNRQDEFLKSEKIRIEGFQEEVNYRQGQISIIQSESKEIASKVKEVHGVIQTELSKIAGEDVPQLQTKIKEQLTDNRHREAVRHYQDIVEHFKESAKKRAQRSLHQVLTRYEPNFFWPKSSNTVELDQSPHTMIFRLEHQPELDRLRELAEVEIEYQEQQEKRPGLIKLSGGMGIKREAARLAILETTQGTISQWGKVEDSYEKYRQRLWQHALELGNRAVRHLGISEIHEEIQRMVGFLNWRTSYRQNQYLHTFEVAKIAGIVAEELGMDAEKARRCGLMHDIGKSIDYNIPLGHAVISGDYADRFGETQEICDTVMSHHDELIVETPLAYVLKTADTLSGARPGARVNLEEGYQMRLADLETAIRSFQGIDKVFIMNGAREVHVEVKPGKVNEHQIKELTEAIARKIENDVAFPGQIKVLLTRRFEASAVA
jgi:ribonuclease Y